MESNTRYSNSKFFALFAHKNHSLWNKIIGCEVKHNTLGDGKIVEIIEGKDCVYITVEFAGLPEHKGLKKFSNTSFTEGHFGNIELNHFLIPGFNEFYERKLKEEKERLIKEKIEANRIEELRRMQEEQERIEAKSLEEFNLLKQNYGLSKQRFKSIASPLYMILLKIESMEVLDEDDIEWLKGNKMFKIIAMYYEKEYLKTKNQWNLVKASSNLRRSDESYRAIELLENEHSKDSKLMSAILTTCGGAYRDINDVIKAEKHAKEAIDIGDESFYPFNLLGAIYYQKGMPEEGDKCFNKAIELGSDLRIMDKEIENSFKIAGEDEQIRVAKYLLDKDEQKYQWVKYYVK